MCEGSGRGLITSNLVKLDTFGGKGIRVFLSLHYRYVGLSGEYSGGSRGGHGNIGIWHPKFTRVMPEVDFITTS